MDTSLFFPIFGLSVLSSWIVTLGVRRLALRWGVVAKRNDRRRHLRDTPLLGGTGFYLVLSALTLLLALGEDASGRALISWREAFCFLGGLTLIFAVGVWDDFTELKAPPKLAVQLLAAILILLSEPELPPAFQDTFLPSWVIAIILVLWIVGITNAMNMIDGLDGLCAGIGAIGAISLTAIILTTGAHFAFAPYIIVALAGCCVGFLFLNFNPAKIFLGDSGSLLIGFVLAVASIKMEVKRSLFISLSIPIMMLGLPLMDVAFSVIRRSRQSRSVFQGDRSHLHHRLQQVGLSHRSAVLLLWIGAAYLNAEAFFLAQIPLNYSFYVYGSVIATLVFWVMSLYYIERRLSFQASSYSHLFMKKEDHELRDRQRLVRYLRALMIPGADGRVPPFSAVVIDGQDFIREVALSRPELMVGFYVKLYGILRERLRRDDLVARVGEHRFVALLPGLSGAEAKGSEVIGYLSSSVKALQERHRVFQSSALRPEGFIVLHFPEDASRIFMMLGVSRSEVEVAANRPAARAA